MLSPRLLFGDDSEFGKLAKIYGVQGEKYKELSLEEVKERVKQQVQELPDPPKSSLEEKKGTLKRSSGLFNAWVQCIVHFTKDKYVYVFDMETDYNPVFTFDAVRTKASGGEGLEFEIVETKKKLVDGVALTSKAMKFLAESEEEKKEWIEVINAAAKKN